MHLALPNVVKHRSPIFYAQKMTYPTICNQSPRRSTEKQRAVVSLFILLDLVLIPVLPDYQPLSIITFLSREYQTRKDSRPIGNMLIPVSPISFGLSNKREQFRALAIELWHWQSFPPPRNSLNLLAHRSCLQ